MNTGQPESEKVVSELDVPDPGDVHEPEVEKDGTGEVDEKTDDLDVLGSASDDQELTQIEIEENPALAIGPPPDGGLTAWLQVVAAFFANFNSWGIVNAYGVYQEYYQSEMLRNKSSGQISWIGSLSGCLLLMGTQFFGFPLDAGYMKLMALAGSLLQFLSLMLLGSLARNYWSVMLTQGLFTGVVSALLFILSIGSVAPYFSKKRPLAIGIGASGSSVGGTIYSVMARKLIETVGFAWSTRAIAFVELGTTLIMFLCLKRRLPPRKRKSFVAWECFFHPAFLLYCVGNMSGFCGLYIFFVQYQAYSEHLDPKIQAYYYMTAIVNAGSAVGRIGPGWLASHYGPFNVLIPALVLSMVLAFCWIPATNEGGVISVGVILGVVSGALIGLPGSIVAAMTTNMNRLGIWLSFAFLFSGVGVLIGPPMAGIIERAYGWFWLKLYCALSFLLSIACMVASRQFQTKGKVWARI